MAWIGWVSSGRLRREIVHGIGHREETTQLIAEDVESGSVRQIVVPQQVGDLFEADPVGKLADVISAVEQFALMPSIEAIWLVQC